jgi:hypothetical protein
MKLLGSSLLKKKVKTDELSDLDTQMQLMHKVHLNFAHTNGTGQ